MTYDFDLYSFQDWTLDSSSSMMQSKGVIWSVYFKWKALIEDWADSYKDWSKDLFKFVFDKGVLVESFDL